MKKNKTMLRNKIFALVACLVLLLNLFACVCLAYDVGTSETYISKSTERVGDGVKFFSNSYPLYVDKQYSYFSPEQLELYNISAGWSYICNFAPYQFIYGVQQIDGNPWNNFNYSLSLNSMLYNFGAGYEAKIFSSNIPIKTINTNIEEIGADMFVASNVVDKNTINMSWDNVYNTKTIVNGCYNGRLLIAKFDDIVLDIGGSLSGVDDDWFYRTDIIFRFMDDSNVWYDKGFGIKFPYNDEKYANVVLTYGDIVFNCLGEDLVNYKNPDVTDQQFWASFYRYLEYAGYTEMPDHIDGKYDKWVITDHNVSTQDYYNLFSGCPEIFIDNICFTGKPSYSNPYAQNENNVFYTEFDAGQAGAPRKIYLNTDTAITDTLDYFYKTAPHPPSTDNMPDWVHVTLTWLSSAVSGILSVEFVPHITFGTIVVIILAFAITMWWLKLYGGG